MSFHHYKLYHYGKNTQTGEYLTTPNDIDNVLKISVNLGLGEVADSFSITLNNYDNYQFEKFKVDDKLKIYAKIDGTETLLLEGLIQEKTNNTTTDNKTVTLTGLNRLEKLFNAMVSTSGESVTKPASYWIKNIIDQVNNNNSLGGTNREILYNNSTISTTTQKQVYIRGYEKAFKLIEELSKDEFTGDGQYYYYLDTDNYFHWKKYSDVIEHSINEEDNTVSNRTRRGMFEVVNYIIMNCGKSPYGASILQVDYSVQSINKYGWKVKLVSKESIANELTNKDRNTKPEYWDDDSNFPNNYPYYAVWGEETSSDSDYNDKFVEEVQRQGKSAINALLDKTTGAVNEVQLEAYNNTSFAYSLGQLTRLTIPSNYWSNPEDLRITSITYSFDTKGWITMLKLKEDDEIFNTTT